MITPQILPSFILISKKKLNQSAANTANAVGASIMVSISNNYRVKSPPSRPCFNSYLYSETIVCSSICSFIRTYSVFSRHISEERTTSGDLL